MENGFHNGGTGMTNLSPETMRTVMAEPNFSIGRYILLRHHPEGPLRFQGNTTYPSLQKAQKEARAYIRDNPSQKVMVVRIVGSLWQDPRPEIFTDCPND